MEADERRQPVERQRPTCGARTRAGAACRGRPMAGGHCRVHGGDVGEGGVAGEYGARLAERLGERREAAEAEETLVSVRDELALLDAHTGLLLEQLTERPSTANDALWRQVMKNIDLRRKLVGTELSLVVFRQRYLGEREAMALVGALVEAVRRHVPDDATLSAISRELVGILRRSGLE